MNLLSYAPYIGIGCTVLLAALALYYFFAYRSERCKARLWRAIAQQRELECRQWRHTNWGQRLRLIGLARKMREFNPGKEKE